jgi:THO complex subunit 7
MAAIRSEHDTQNKIIQGQKSALDGIISDLGNLRFLGKDRDATSEVPSTPGTPAPEEIMDITESIPDTTSVAPGSVRAVEREEGEEERSLSGPSVAEGLGEDDIEMGEVEEPKNDKGKKKLREELEEGEASDTSSALSDPPDD